MRRLLIPLLLLVSCGGFAREDRTITWSADGESVAFQHGAEGMFIAAPGGGAERIFRPEEATIATGTPLWAPDGDRLVFLTARALTPGMASPWLALFAGEAAGRVIAHVPAGYTCWLRENDAKPAALFEAEVDHAGFVAANLAVRWHPDGRHLLFVKRTSPGRHGLFAGNLETGTVRRAFPYDAEALAFDWAPDGERLACVLGSTERGALDGVWLGRPGQRDWWHLRAHYAQGGPFTGVLDGVKAARPAWRPDGGAFAFVSWRPESKRYLLRLALPATRSERLLARMQARIHDVRWHPNGNMLGFVAGDSLRFVRPGETPEPAPATGFVRRFAGWNARGDRYAYIVAEPTPHAPRVLWSFLLAPVPRARDAVHVVDPDGRARSLLSGMRVTFPRWAPHGDRLSCWFTFVPTHRSTLARLAGGGLRPGDPAAIVDARSGDIRWLAVNGFERAQLGHLALLHGDAQRARRLYAEVAPEERPPDLDLFESICAKALGDSETSRRKREAFHAGFRPWVSDPTLALYHALFENDPLLRALARDLHAAEVYLALDRAEEAHAYFAVPRVNDAERLSALLVRGQLLLLDERRAEYARLMREAALPLLENRRGGRPGRFGGALLAGLALLPLSSSGFLASLPEGDRAAPLVAEAADPATLARLREFLATP